MTLTTTRPRVILSCAASLDGYLDDTAPERLLLSNPADFDRVDDLRASCDAILVGSGTVRADNPRLLVRDPARRAARVARGQSPSPLRVVLTRGGAAGSGELEPGESGHTAPDRGALPPGLREAAVFTTEGAPTLVLPAPDGLLGPVLDQLAARGVRRLMVEGGAAVLSAFLVQDLADEIHLATAPFLIGDPKAPRFALPAQYPQNSARRMILAESRSLGDVAYARYLVTRPGADDEDLLALTVELSRSCPPAQGAYSVGALLAAADGTILSTGYSREPLAGLGDPDRNHAEEVALAKPGVRQDPRRLTGTLYTSLEPCSPRASRPLNCTDHILAAGIPRVVLALREPALLAVCDGADRLRAAGVDVVELPALAPLVRSVNAHLLG
ncbi:MAG TPA: dihydrofolate reductase family protein [Actinocrinis sp.]|nr:dihydrofolate reductase family protein [Actinocrinis sp.]